MKLSVFIARRYFLSKHKRGFIHLIAWVAMLGIGIGTMALVVVLSVFNGLEDFNRQIFKIFTADLKLKPRTGKYFEVNPTQIQRIKQLQAVEVLSEIIEDNALVRYRNAQSVCTIKGIEPAYLQASGLAEKVYEGRAVLEQDSLPKAIIGANVQGTLSLILGDEFNPLELWYPEKKISLGLDPEANLQTIMLGVSGVFYVEQQFDNTVLLPLSLAEKLTNSDKQRTAIEIKCKQGTDLIALKKQIQDIYPQLLAQTDDEQNASLLRAIRVEKLFIFIALIFIIGVASFNIFFCLTMLVIDKQDDIRTLSAMGADVSLVKRVFFVEGILIATVGVLSGLVLGLLLCWLQSTFGFLKLGLSTSLIEAYPVKVQPLDILFICFAVLCIGISIAYFPARKAQTFIFKSLE